MRARLVSDEPLDLDKHGGMATQKATDTRRALAEVENNARDLRERQRMLENQLNFCRFRLRPGRRQLPSLATSLTCTPQGWLGPILITAI